MSTTMDSTMNRFLAKLRELLRLRVKDGDLSSDDFDTAVRQAAGHVGGSVRWERTKDAKEFVYEDLASLPPAVKKLPERAQKVWLAAFNNAFKTAPSEGRAAAIAWAAANKITGSEDLDPDAFIRSLEESTMNPFRLLAELALAEDGKTGQVQIFPPVGKYSHPRYGELNITSEFLKTVKGNFDTKIYQQELPLTIDLEHQSALSGAAGWIKDVEIRGDKGMWATVEFNDRGKSLVGADAYRYFSPEFYDKWTDPASSKKYESLLIGGALTNRPFFKGMSPVAMMSEDALCFMEAAEEDMPEEDDEALDDLAEAIVGLGSYTQAELDELSPQQLDALIEAVDILLTEAESFSHHPGPHGPGAGGSGRGPTGAAPRKAARSKLRKNLDSNRGAKLKELRTLRTMKLHSATGQAARGQMVKAAQADLAKTRGMMVAARARRRSETFAEGDMAGKMESMMGMMQKCMDMMGDMKDEMPEGMADDMAGILDKMKKKMPPEKMKSGGNSMTEEETRQLAETQASLKSLTERVEAAEAKTATEAEARKAAEDEAKKAVERVATLERTAQRKTFSEFVKANRLAFQDEVDKAVDRLEVLATKLSDEEFSDYLAERKLWHNQMKQSAILTPAGHQGGGETSAEGQINAAVRKAMSEDPKLSESDAIVKVANDSPALYARYDREQNRRIKRGEED